MRRVVFGAFLAIVSVFFGMCCTSKFQHPVCVKNETRVEDIAYKSTVKLQVRRIGHTEALGASGFAIDKSRIMTAGHFCLTAYEGAVTGLLEDSVEIVYVNNNGELSIIENAKVESIDEKLDLCVIKKEKHGIVPLDLAGEKTELKVHDSVIIVGSPLGFFPVTESGRVITPLSEGFNVVSLNGRLLVSAPVTSGNSGGPVLNRQGKVIGVVIAKIRGFDHVAFAVTLKDMHKFLENEYGE